MKNLNEEKFLEAIKNEDIEKVKELIDLGVNPSANDNLAIKYILSAGNLTIFNLLMNSNKLTLPDHLMTLKQDHLYNFYKNDIVSFEDKRMLDNYFKNLLDNDVSVETTQLHLFLVFKIYEFNFDPHQIDNFSKIVEKYGKDKLVDFPAYAKYSGKVVEYNNIFA